jgi:hypothetical protein
VLIDLEEGQGWGQPSPPTHIGVLPEFVIRTEAIRPAADALAERLHDVEPFPPGHVETEGHFKRQRLAVVGLMRLHLEAFLAMQPHIESIDNRFLHDRYDSRIRGKFFNKDYFTINNVTLALKQGSRFHIPRWEKFDLFELGVPHE